MATPLVAVPAYRLEPGRVLRWRAGGAALSDLYLDALGRAGARAAILPAPATTDSTEPHEVLAPFDGLLLAGGGDVDPARYGGVGHSAVYGVDARRDGFEIGLVTAAVELGLPVLAICRGIQVVNVAFGGTVFSHLPDAPGLGPHGIPREPFLLHEVKVDESSLLAGATGRVALSCASSHHQGIDRLGEDLTAVGWSDDGLVEAVEREDGWLIGVQWHPEETAEDDPAQQALFDAFAERARARSRG